MKRRTSIAVLHAAVLAFLLGTAAGAAAEPASGVLRVCQDPNNLPFSNEQGEGFENRIAQILADEMKVPLETVWYPQRMNVVRNTLRYRLPGDVGYRCDLLTGMPASFDAVATTKPYYRSTYVLAYVKGRGLEVDSSDAFLALDRAQLSKLRIGVYDRSPVVRWLTRHGLVDQAVPYQTMNPDPSHYPGQLIDRELASGRIDVAMIWGPIAGYFASRVQNAEIAVVPLKSEPGVPFDFAMSMGVRHGEPEWRARIQAALDANRERIDAVLREFGVPLVDEAGDPLP
ncbi:MAG: substrate-binding domain-containing protein [Burkholderiales bacterium]